MLYYRPREGQAACSGLVSIGAGLLQVGWYYPLPGDQASGYSAIDLANRGLNPVPRTIYYASSLLPSCMTAGQSHLNMLIGGWSSVSGYVYPALQPLVSDLKPIYRAYTHTTADFTLLPSPSNEAEAKDITHYEPHSIATAVIVPAVPIFANNSITHNMVTQQQLEANLTQLQREMDQLVSGWLNDPNGLQVFGPVWNASLDINDPSNPYALPYELYGAPYISYSSFKQNNWTRDEWLSHAPYLTTNGNNAPMTYIGALALIYHAEWSIHYKRADILDRVVAGVDYYMHEQGSNGGFVAPNDNSGWCGAPYRNDICGSALEGVGPYSIGIAVTELFSELQDAGYLDEMIDYNLDKKQIISRRQGWAKMLKLFIDGTFAVQERRGGCPNQDLFQVEAMLIGNSVYESLLSVTPPLNDSDILVMVNQATGFLDQARRPEDGPYFTKSGMIMECFGVWGGGGLEVRMQCFGVWGGGGLEVRMQQQPYSFISAIISITPVLS